MANAVIFDVDGTLCDVSSIRWLVAPSHPDFVKRDFDRFHESSAHCPPHEWVASLTRAHARSGHKILIVTARPAKWAPLTMSWLTRNNIPVDVLHHRADNDYRPDYEVKSDILAQIAADGHEVRHAYDDNPNVVKLWLERGIPTTVVPGYTN